jgi:hypothetical protein
MLTYYFVFDKSKHTLNFFNCIKYQNFHKIEYHILCIILGDWLKILSYEIVVSPNQHIHLPKEKPTYSPDRIERYCKFFFW